MNTSLLEHKILELNFSFLRKKKKNGVLLTKNYLDIESNLSSPDILFALETAGLKFHADAVYFRYFQDGRGYSPHIYIFDYTQKILTNEERNEIHIKMWNGYQVPVYIIIEKSSVGVFDSRKKPKGDNVDYAREIIKLTGKAIKEFQAQSFDDGLFWEEQNEKKNFSFEQSATRDLIRGLKEVFKSFQKKSKLDRDVALKLLIQSLLIKYLEERDENNASGYFTKTYFKKKFNCENFCATIRKGKLLDLLDQLAKDFNGKIFEWDVKNETNEREAIRQSEVNHLADYLDGDNIDGQFVLWKLYSFSHLPVEVISSVYEELLTDSKDIVYTPEMIVSTLVDECMPLKSPQKDFKLIDVSCGSGIFLVKTYKRVVQWWRYEKWLKTGELTKPSLSVLKELLLKSIHGIDIEKDAIRLSIFSLALAILDEVNLDPPTWGELEFPDLSKNIIEQDFFKYIAAKPEPEFDLVIGNPPFNLKHVNGKEPGRKDYFENLKDSINYQCEIAIPDENPALHFLVQSMRILKKEGLLAMIQPSGPLLYKNLAFKQRLFSKYNLLQALDFTKLADKLWGRKNVAATAIFIQNSVPDNQDVLHLVANRTFSNINRLFLEFDHYDFHLINKQTAHSNLNVWKANLMGGGRLLQLIERLSGMTTFESFLDEKRHKNNWKYCEGYNLGNKSLTAPHLYNKTAIRTEDFKETGITKSYIEKEIKFEGPRERDKNIFLKPHILIKKNIGEIKVPIEFLDYDAVFNKGIIGIHAPPRESGELKKVYSAFSQNNSVYRFFILATSSRLQIGRATSILKQDIDRLPFPENLSPIKINSVEKILINDVLTYQLGKSKFKLSEDTPIAQVKYYSYIYAQTLNSIYRTEDKSFKLLKILDIGKYYALHFEYKAGNTEPELNNSTDLEQYLNTVIPSRKANQGATQIQKIMKIYGQDCIIIAKPKQLRYWLSSIALRDADETFADYIKSRYHNVER